MAEYVGIDLGTTLSGLAYLKPDGNPEIVPNADGERLTPSVVYFDSHEDVKLVGSAARDGGDPDRTIFQIKRLMDDPEHLVKIDGKNWTPAEISALVLAKLKRECSRIIGDINEVVITVPANFNELARKSTIAAAEMAGMKVKRLVNEPTAAAVYYAESQGVKGKVLVYDLGGGTLDVTILDVGDDRIRILTSEGARHLGGSNFDELLLSAYDDQYRKQMSADLYADERHRRRILQAIEDAKKMLSKLQRVNDTVANDQNSGIARIDLTRDHFEAMIRNMLTRTVMLVEQALDSCNLKTTDIDHVVLVGGSTRIPKVKKMLEKLFGQTPKSCGNVDECVALGAALFAKSSARIQEVCNASYGTLAMVYNAATQEEKVMNSVVIPKNTPIPCSNSQIYFTSEDNERIIEVDITQGEDEDPRFIDVHVRRLCGSHIHYSRVFGSSNVARYQVERVFNEVEKFPSNKLADRTIIKLDKNYFGVYSSAQAQHHFKFKPSKKALFFLGAAIVTLWLCYRVYDRMYANEPEPATAESAQSKSAMDTASSLATGAMGSLLSSATQGDDKPQTRAEYLASLAPRIPDVPASAPVYDSLTQPQTHPRLFCVSSTDPALIHRSDAPWDVVDGDTTSCQCYTQQATRIKTSFSFCLNAVKNGYFDNTRPAYNAQQNMMPPQPAAIARVEPNVQTAPAQTERYPRITVVEYEKGRFLW